MAPNDVGSSLAQGFGMAKSETCQRKICSLRQILIDLMLFHGPYKIPVYARFLTFPAPLIDFFFICYAYGFASSRSRVHSETWFVALSPLRSVTTVLKKCESRINWLGFGVSCVLVMGVQWFTRPPF